MTLAAPALRRRRSAYLVDAAVALAAAVLVLALVAGLALHVAHRDGALAPGVTDWWAMPLVGGIAFGGAGLWLAHARPELVIGWLLAGVGVVLATSGAGLEYGAAVLAERPHDPAATWAFWYANWAWATCLVAVGTVVPLVLPEGRLPSRRWRPALAVTIAAVLLVSVQWMLTPYGSWSSALARAGVTNPLAVEWATSPVFGNLELVVALAAVAAALLSLVVRWRSADREGRGQLKWLGLGAVAGVVLFFLAFVLGPVLTALALVPLPAACLVAALRHGLWDVDVVISRSLVYVTLMAVVVAVYAAVVALAGEALGAGTGAPIVATALVAVLALPLHRRLSVLVNRLVHGEPEEPVAVLQQLGDRLAAAQDDATLAQQVLPDLVATVARTLHLPYVAVQLADGTEVARGDRPEELVRTPLVHAGADVGSLVVAVRPGGLPDADRRMLAVLAQQAAVAVHTVVLAREVRRSREEAVTAREEERRRLYRDLHDGLGPSLAALALQVESARDLMDADPARARQLLGRTVAGLTTTVRDVRGVVHGLRPPALDDLGLPEALRELGARFADGRLAVDVEVAPRGTLPDLPAGVEVATYAIVAEALTNVSRHAAADRVQVCVTAAEEMLVVRVTDDGRGFGGEARPGVGLVSMRRRAEELGGSLLVTRGPDGRGTAVEARLPVPA